MVEYIDPVTGTASMVDFSNDSRMRLVANHPSCGTVLGNHVFAASDASQSLLVPARPAGWPNGCAGLTSFSVQAEVDVSGTLLLSSPLTVALVRFTSLTLTLHSHPAGPSPLNELRKIQCTGTYQHARASVLHRHSNLGNLNFSARTAKLHLPHPFHTHVCTP